MSRALGVLIVLVCQFSWAGKVEYFHSEGVFMDGYDAVAYLEEQKAVKGKKDHSFSYEGTQFYFSSEKNKKLFEKSPQKYLPAYNGWCAYAMAETGKLVKVDPETFKIVNGKAYFFYNTIWADTLKKWNSKIEGSAEKESQLIQKADGLWQQKLSQ